MLEKLKTLLVLALCGAGAANADAIDDLTRGNGLRFLWARGSLDDASFSTGNWVLPKATDILDVEVPLTNFGLSNPTVVHLTGTRGPTASTVVWSFDQWLSPELVSGGTHVQHVWGQIVAQARLTPPTTSCSGASCAFNVTLTPGAGSAVHVHGCSYVWPACWGFDRDIAVRGFLGMGGLPPSRLESLSLDLPASRCSSSGVVSVAGTVRLQAPAPSTGATVQLRSSHPQVSVHSVFVRANERTARFTATLAAGFASTATVTASAGGISHAAVVDRSACVSILWPLLAELLPVQWQYPFLLDDGNVIARAKGTDLVLTPKSQATFDLSAKLGLSSARVVAIGRAGEMVGTTSNGETFSWNTRASLATAVKGVSPVAVTPTGLALVRSAATGDLQLLDEHGVLGVPALKGLEVTRARGNANGVFAVGLVAQGKVVPALLSEAGAKALSWLEGEAIEVLASGEVVGHALDPKGTQLAFRIVPGKPMKWVPAPLGCSAVTVAGANEAGWLFGTASCGQLGTRAWLADPYGDVRRLDALVSLSGITPREVLGVTDHNTVLARGDDSKGAPVFFLLHP